MRLLPDEVTEVKNVAGRWKRQYCRDGQWSTVVDGDSSLIYNKLIIARTAADVAEAIGNTSWVGTSCTECHERAIVLVGQEEDYDSHTVYLCAGCVRRLQRFIELPQSSDAVDPVGGKG